MSDAVLRESEVAIRIEDQTQRHVRDRHRTRSPRRQRQDVRRVIPVARAEDCLQAVEAISLGARRFIVPLRESVGNHRLPCPCVSADGADVPYAVLTGA